MAPSVIFFEECSCGEIWTGQNNGSQVLNSVAYGNGVYVAVGNTGVIMYSTDATTWNTVPSLPSVNFVHVYYANGLFIANSYSTASTTANKIYTSANGSTWTNRAVSGNEIVLYAGGFGTNGTFNRHYLTGYQSTGGTSRQQTSTDGITWTNTSFNPYGSTGNIPYSVYYFGGRWFAPVLISGQGNVGYATPNASTGLAGAFTSVALPNDASGSGVAQRIAYSPDSNTLVAVGGSRISYSTDLGVTWTNAVRPNASSIAGVTYGNGLFVIVTRATAHVAASIFTSPDGINWTANAFSPATTNNTGLAGITYGNELFVAVGSPDSSSLNYNVATAPCDC